MEDHYRNNVTLETSPADELSITFELIKTGLGRGTNMAWSYQGFGDLWSMHAMVDAILADTTTTIHGGGEGAVGGRRREEQSLILLLLWNAWMMMSQ